MAILDPADFNQLYVVANAMEVGLSRRDFTTALTIVGRLHLPADATAHRQISFYRSLHLADFALAQSCALGSPVAWEQFLRRFNPWLYGAAITVAKNEQIAKELADSLAGDLFASKIASYSGRGSLEGWLKALLTHSYIDRYRAQRRVVSIEEHIEILKGLCVAPDVLPAKGDIRFDRAIEAAFLARPADERFLLAAYFFDGWTLARIAAAFGIHESSASRRMNQILSKLRKAIHRHLQNEGMSPAQIAESFEWKEWATSLDIRGLLLRGLAGE